MPRSLSISVPSPWTVESASLWMQHSLDWHAPDSRAPERLESADGGRALLYSSTDACISVTRDLGGFVPAVEVSFTPRFMSPDGRRIMMGTILAFARESASLLFLYSSEDVLLLCHGGRCEVPADALEWWRGEGVGDMIP